MDETTQQNAALVEQAAASAEALSGQAATMLEIVRRFRLDESHVGESLAPAALEAPSVRVSAALPKPKMAARPTAAPGRKPTAAAKATDDDDDWSEF